MTIRIVRTRERWRIAHLTWENEHQTDSMFLSVSLSPRLYAWQPIAQPCMQDYTLTLCGARLHYRRMARWDTSHIDVLP